MFSLPIIAQVIEKVTGVVSKAVPDRDLAARINREIAALDYSFLGKLIEARAAVLVAELKGGWLQRNWRPITMLSFVSIIVNNHILYPYLSLFWPAAPLLPTPPDLWALLKIGIGGYIVGRSGEKIAQHFKRGGHNGE